MNHFEETGQRVKFELERRPLVTPPEEWPLLARALEFLETQGFVPLTHEGKSVGNVAMRTSLKSGKSAKSEGLIVSRSGRSAGPCRVDDFVHVLSFDPVKWKATYESTREEILPTSDTPLYWMALVEMPERMGWKQQPKVALHGHAFSKEEDAQRLQIPISSHVTEFSTPSDRQSLMDLLQKFPYPAYKSFIRRGHGFFVLAETVDEAIEIVKKMKSS